jgi:hypothetical protein
MLRDTQDLIQKIEAIWEKFDSGKMTGQEARTHVALARTLIEAKKVEIAVAHLNVSHIPPVALGAGKHALKIAGRKVS